MTPGIGGRISGEPNLEKQIERQMGCMTGFLQLFERQQTIAGKRFYSAKQLHISPTADSFSTSERSEASSTAFVKAAPPSPALESFPSSPDKHHLPRPSPTLPIPIFEVRDGFKTSWKLREVPRLSLDSRAVVDARGKLRPRDIRTTTPLLSGYPSDCSDVDDYQEKQRRSPSVVARLMGLEALPGSCVEHQPKRSELRRSSSESRVSRDLSQFKFQKHIPIPSEELFRPRKVDCSEFTLRDKPEPPRSKPVSLQRKNVFDSQEFFPEPKQTGFINGEVEKRLRKHGIDERDKDLETLKQILEALHLKGLLHAKPPKFSNADRLNALYNHQPRMSAIVMKPQPKPFPRSPESDRPPLQHRSASFRSTAAPEIIPSSRSGRDPFRRSIIKPPEPIESSRSPINSPGRRKPPFNVEAQRASQPERRIAAIHSPRASLPKGLGSDQIGIRSPRIRRSKADVTAKYTLGDDDPSSTFSDASILCSPCHFDLERVSTEYKSGRSLLKRCDKLLDSIEAITSSAERTEQVTATDQQPSPVSVLDSPFLSVSEESLSSSVPKRSINFEDRTEDLPSEDHRKPEKRPTAGCRNGQEDIETCLDDDYAYVAEIILGNDGFGGPADVFTALERGHRGNGNWKTSVVHRRLLFDTVTEIMDRKRNVMNPWIALDGSRSASFPILQEVWEELRGLREQVAAENVMELVGKVIRQDVVGKTAGEQGEWASPVAEMSGAILHIEQQLFKDLVADTIRELTDLAGRRRPATLLPCRKLIF
ncbi:hypothetical protein KSP39_PZI005173 [Platanthera zijinensis]|uniref:DUF4378 domain-containing protein n=1 Tax=Platanthera zijinensis TaxID=2320716 RepID=A0AAP0BSQ4_9ASPA